MSSYSFKFKDGSSSLANGSTTPDATAAKVEAKTAATVVIIGTYDTGLNPANIAWIQANRISQLISAYLPAPALVSIMLVKATAGGTVRLDITPAIPPVTVPAPPALNTTFPTRRLYEDFSAGVPAGWSWYPAPWKDSSQNGIYRGAAGASVVNGVLNIKLEKDSTGWRSTAVVPLLGQTYGRYSIRIRATGDPDWKIVPLLWPDDNIWPAHGEIDFPEGPVGGLVNGYNHYASVNGGQDEVKTTALSSDWHTYTTEWMPGLIVFYLDGKEVGRSTKYVSVFPMHWVLQFETSLMAGKIPHGPALVEIDWVAIDAYFR
jgi:hypothetical protein